MVATPRLGRTLFHWGNTLIMENQMEKNMENEMEIGQIMGNTRVIL